MVSHYCAQYISNDTLIQALALGHVRSLPWGVGLRVEVAGVLGEQEHEVVVRDCRSSEGGGPASSVSLPSAPWWASRWWRGASCPPAPWSLLSRTHLPPLPPEAHLVLLGLAWSPQPSQVACSR